MKKLLAWLTFFLLVGTVFAVAAEKPSKRDSERASDLQPAALPEPAGEGGYFERGGTDVGRGYSHGGKQLARGAGGFGKKFAKGEFGEAGRSFGRGAAEFGKGIGVGTARGFKNFGLAFRTLGKKIDPAKRDDQKNQQKSN